jgi:uncharacterized membrane protein
MRNTQVLLATAVAGLTAGTLLTATGASAAPVCAEQERCYGVAKAGKNDCATSTSACATTAKQDFQRDAWIYVPKGTCLKLAGGTPEIKKK